MEACRRKFQLWESKNLRRGQMEMLLSVIQITSAVCGLKKTDFANPRQLLNNSYKFSLELLFFHCVPPFVLMWLVDILGLNMIVGHNLFNWKMPPDPL